jgi:hypothetical protein
MMLSTMTFRLIFTAFLLLSLVQPSYARCWKPSLSHVRRHSTNTVPPGDTERRRHTNERFWRPSLSSRRDHSKKYVTGDTERKRHTAKDDDVFAVRPVSSWRRPAHADPLLQADEKNEGRRRTSHSKEALGSECSERSAQQILDAQREEYIREVALTSSWN